MDMLSHHYQPIAVLNCHRHSHRPLPLDATLNYFGLLASSYFSHLALVITPTGFWETYTSVVRSAVYIVSALSLQHANSEGYIDDRDIWSQNRQTLYFGK